MKILVTGGAGYLGSIMVPELLNKGHFVTVIDNFMYNQTSLLDCCYRKELTVIRGDVRDRSLLKKCLKEVNAIIPLACLVGAPLCDRVPLEAQSINYDAIQLILELRNKEQIIIFPTTNSGYGIGQENIYCTEETPLNPISLYGKLKVAIERDLLSDGNVVTLRLATVFGISPRMRLDLLVNDFTYRAFYNGYHVLYQAHFKRNYIYVRDVARAFLHCLNNFETMKDQPYNVGLSDANLSKWQLCEEIKKQIPSFYFIEAKVGEDPDKRNYMVSNEKIEATGFKPLYTLQEGIAELIKGYQIIKINQYANV
ncbi:MAG: NAD-dependent epimerase/dehydratase family protein [bacterium]